MNEQTTWTGKIYANLERGQKTGLQLKKGDIITVIASGYIKYAYADNKWADPTSPIPTSGNQYTDESTVLVALIGNDPTRYPIGTGVLNWSVPTDGELERVRFTRGHIRTI
ncbi:LecA/PA-IL family lectin [Ochrobactrum sp. BD67]